MKKYSYAVHTGIAGGRNFAAAALCREERVTDIQNRLRMLDQMLSPCEIRDPVLLDHLLSDGLRKVCPEDVSAAAITMSAWDRGPIGGSVIGAPHSDGASAEGELEALEEGLWFMAYPGGPGLVLTCSRPLARGAQQLISGQRCKQCPPWPALKLWLRQHNIESYLYVTDGCGSRGFLAAAGQNGMSEIDLAQLPYLSERENDSK